MDRPICKNCKYFATPFGLSDCHHPNFSYRDHVRGGIIGNVCWETRLDKCKGEYYEERVSLIKRIIRKIKGSK